MNTKITSMINNQSSVHFLNYSDRYPLFHIYYEEKGTGDYYWLYFTVRIKNQYVQYSGYHSDGFKSSKSYISYISGELKGFYDEVMKWT